MSFKKYTNWQSQAGCTIAIAIVLCSATPFMKTPNLSGLVALQLTKQNNASVAIAIASDGNINQD